MSRVTLQGLLIAALALALVACSQTTPTLTATLPPSSTPTPAFTPDPAPESSYLTEEIPPCTPAPGSAVDPCERLTDVFGIPDPPGSVFWLGDEPPRDIQYFLAGDSKTYVPHVVVRGTYLPDTVRCTTGNLFQPPAYRNQDNVRNFTFIYCYADVRVNAYVLGSGPSRLTVLVYWSIRRGPGEEEVRLSLESVLSRGNPDRMIQGITGREAMLFIGPSPDASIESWQVMNTWDVQRMPDGTVVAVHPLRKEWKKLRDDWEQYLSQLEVTLPSFGTAVTTAHQARLAANSGRTRPDATFPMLVSDANRLSDFFREIGSYDDPDAPPVQPPPPCGLAVPDQADNPGLIQDCMALLAAKDALRGTASLNWSVERSITEWDGVTTGGTPLRVTRLELPDKSLSGSVPPELGRLSGLTRLDLSANSLTGALPEELGLLSDLAFIRLAGNSFTGCVPYALRNVADSDLGSVGIPYCEAPVCIQPFPNRSVTNPTLQLKREPFTHATQSWDSRCMSSHAPTHNAQFYTFVNHDSSRVNDEIVLATMRVNIKMSTRHDDVQLLLLGAQLLQGLEPDAPIVATAEAVEAEAGALRTLEIEEVVPYGAYTIEVRAKNPGDAVFDLTASHAYGPPIFEQDSYTFSVAEDAGTFASVGTVSATDPGDRAVTYRITSGGTGKFDIDHNIGDIIVTGGLDYETTPTYTLTVEARNPDGRTDTVTVTINVTDVAGR